MDTDFVARATYVAQRAKSEGYEDVASWMQAMLTHKIKRERPRRRRTVKAKIAGIRGVIELDAARIKELTEVTK